MQKRDKGKEKDLINGISKKSHYGYKYDLNNVNQNRFSNDINWNEWIGFMLIWTEKKWNIS